MSNKPMILYNSEEAARQETVTGWVSSNNRFWGDDEHMARHDGCTHLVCECGNIHSKGYTKCDACREKVYTELYLAKPMKEWEETVPVFSNKENEFFFDIDAVMEYCEDNDVKMEDLQLVICEQEYAHPIDGSDYYSDLLPDDQTLEDIDPKLAELFNSLNEYILKNKPVLSWKPGKFRTSLTKNH